LDSVGEQAGALHADADDAEAQAVAWCRRLQRQRDMLRLKKNCRRSRERSGGTGGAMEELTAGKIFFMVLSWRKLTVESAKLKKRDQ